MNPGNARAASAAACALWLASCGHEQAAPPPSPASASSPAGPVYEIHARGTGRQPVTITNIAHGSREYTLLAASVLYATNLQQGTFYDNTMYFFKGAKRRLTVTAPIATVDEATHNVHLWGGVLAKTAGDDTLRSQSMTYDERTRLLTAVGNVVAGDPAGYQLTGTRAVADLDLQQIHLFGETPTGTGAPLQSSQPGGGTTP